MAIGIFDENNEQPIGTKLLRLITCPKSGVADIVVVDHTGTPVPQGYMGSVSDVGITPYIDFNVDGISVYGDSVSIQSPVFA